MTSVYDAKGRLCPVTVIAAGDNVLLRRLTEENEGYSAVQVGFGAQKESRVTKARCSVNSRRPESSRSDSCANFACESDLPEGDDQLERYAISGGRLRRCDWPLERQRFSGRDEEAQLPRARRGARFEDAPAHRRGWQSFYAGTHLEEPGNARSHGRSARDGAKSTGHAGARSRKIILISGAVPGANGSYVIVRPAIKHPERLRALHAEHRKHEEEEKAKKPKTLREMAQKK